MKEKISVITAVYNTEKYLRKCLDSLINQTYKNIEIIIVEDCSTDNSKEILNEYKKYNNVKIIYNKKNSGLSYSRNIGLENATGKYIGYVDSDDYIDLDFYEKMMNNIIKNKSDIVICDIKTVYENTGDIILNKVCKNDTSKINIINNGLAAACWNKVYKKEVIEKYPFEVGKINEDIAVVIPSIINANNVSYEENCYYYYVQRNNSIQNSNFNDKKFDIFNGVELTLERIKNTDNFNDIKDCLVYNQLITFLMYVITKENIFFKRYSILKKYRKYSKKYNINRNKYFIDFLNEIGGKHAKYYKLLIDLNSKGLILFDNILITFYSLLSKVFTKKVKEINNISENDLIEAAIKQAGMTEPKIRLSVVIPNYNYEKFLEERIYSVLNQSYKIYELIILDDKSSDNSVEKINHIVSKKKKYIKVSTIYNEKNSGSAFKQWKKGFEHATGDYVWIAEADDYCNKDLIKNIIKPCLYDSDIMISYADTAFMDSNGKIIMKTIKNEIDVQKSGHWNSSFINNGIDEIKDFAYLNCTIANVSSCIIKNGDYRRRNYSDR